uniref:Uncharacterized protein n=1 Tax=Anguilla anguilla TaxID=7936 RepID=A0A0E9TD90_ANGAN
MRLFILTRYCGERGGGNVSFINENCATKDKTDKNIFLDLDPGKHV